MKWIAALLLLFGAPLAANCVVPTDYTGNVRLTRMDVVVVHRGRPEDKSGYEQLIIQLQPRFDSTTGGPAKMAWILPIPGESLRYDVTTAEVVAAGPAMHDRLFQLARKQWADKTDFQWPEWLPTSMTHRDEDHQLVPQLATENAQAVGPYTITPIRSVGASGVRQLSAYLSQNGFDPISQADLDYYAREDFTFLCVKVEPNAGESALPLAPYLPPLVIGFETPKPFVPLKFESGMGDFALDLTIVSDKPLDTDGFGALREELNPVNHGYVQLVNLYSLSALPAELAAGLDGRTTQDDPSRWYVNRIESSGAASKAKHGNVLEARNEEAFFPIGDVTDELPGFWYYGDEDISFIDRFFREHAMAVFVGLGLVFFVTLFIKVRINRKRYLAGLEQAKA